MVTTRIRRKRKSKKTEFQKNQSEGLILERVYFFPGKVNYLQNQLQRIEYKQQAGIGNKQGKSQNRAHAGNNLNN
jgi:hypothetical protein